MYTIHGLRAKVVQRHSCNFVGIVQYILCLIIRRGSRWCYFIRKFIRLLPKHFMKSKISRIVSKAFGAYFRFVKEFRHYRSGQLFFQSTTLSAQIKHPKPICFISQHIIRKCENKIPSFRIKFQIS